jgi:hypothetical protein
MTSSLPVSNTIIQLEIVAEDVQQQDLGDVAEASQNIIDYLSKNGCTITPTHTGRMGGPIYDILVHGYQIVHNNEDLLAALFASVAATLKLISKHKKREKQKKTLLIPTPIPVEIDLPTKDGQITLKAPDAESAIKMLEQLQITQPEQVRKVTPQGKAKIKVDIPKQKWHRQH